MATTLKITAKRLNMVDTSPFLILRRQAGRFQTASNPVLFSPMLYLGFLAGSAGRATPHGSYFSVGSGILSSAFL